MTTDWTSLTVRMTKDERASIKISATLEGKTMSRYLLDLHKAHLAKGGVTMEQDPHSPR